MIVLTDLNATMSCIIGFVGGKHLQKCSYILLLQKQFGTICTNV